MKKAQEKKLDVAAKSRPMLRWQTWVTKLDRIRNERIRGTTKVKSHGHVLRREYECVGNRVVVMEVPEKRRKGKPKRMWLDTITNDLTERENSQRRKHKTGLNGGV